MDDSSQPDEPRVVRDALSILEAADAHGLKLRVFGGVAVWLVATSARTGPFSRSYKDLDFVALSKDSRAIESLLEELGYTPDADFNQFHGASRLMYTDAGGRASIDVFLDRVTMCHSLELAKRLGKGPTLAASDLLLSKLQVVETNERDLLDALALLADADLDVGRIVRLLAEDWGWWRTTTAVLDKVEQYGVGLPETEPRDRALRNLVLLRDAIARAPRSLKWKLRARVGERVQWYETPDEVGG